MAWASRIEAWNDGATLPTVRQCRHPLRRVPLTSACQLLANPDEAAVDSHDFMHQRDAAAVIGEALGIPPHLSLVFRRTALPNRPSGRLTHTMRAHRYRAR